MTTFRPRVAKTRRLVTFLVILATVLYFSYSQGTAYSSRGRVSSPGSGAGIDVNTHAKQSGAKPSTNTITNTNHGADVGADRRNRPAPAPTVFANSSRALVICRTTQEDVSYFFQPHADLPPMDGFVYVTNDDKAPLRPPINKGREAMVYLTYMIDNYDSLHDVNIFVHAHRYAWHNNDVMAHDMVSMVRQLSDPSVQRRGFVNLRCNWMIGCPNWIHPDPDHYYKTDRERKNNKKVKPEEFLIGETFRQFFPDAPLPQVISTPAGAQFALSRDQIRSVPKEKLMEIREWLINTTLPDNLSGRILEYLWHYIFTKQAILCVPEHACFCDTYGLCFGGQKNLSDFNVLAGDLRRMFYNRKDFEAKMRVFEEAKTHKFLNESQRPSWLKTDTKNRLDIEIARTASSAQARVQSALQRGLSPANRAVEAGRAWKEGDGF